MAYGLVTAAYNEEAFIEATIRSVLGQTVQPAAWIVVSDGSTDGTDDIVARFARLHPFIKLLRRQRGMTRSFQSKILAVNHAVSLLRDLELEYIGNLDADVTFGPEYFAQLIQLMRQEPRLGIGGGWIHELQDGEFRPRPFNADDTVPHAVQFVRAACLESIQGYVALPYGGADTLASFAAEKHGWIVRAVPHLPVFHHRRTASAGSRFRNYFRSGMVEDSLGYDPAFQAIKCFSRLNERPYVVRSILRFAGFWRSRLAHGSRAVDPELVRFIRMRQRRRLREIVTSGAGR